MFVAGFIRSPKMNFLTAEVVGRGSGGLAISLVNQGGAMFTLPIAGTTARSGDKVTLGSGRSISGMPARATPI